MNTVQPDESVNFAAKAQAVLDFLDQTLGA